MPDPSSPSRGTGADRSLIGTRPADRIGAAREERAARKSAPQPSWLGRPAVGWRGMLSFRDQKDRDTVADRDDCQEDERSLNGIEHHDTSAPEPARLGPIGKPRPGMVG